MLQNSPWSAPLDVHRAGVLYPSTLSSSHRCGVAIQEIATLPRPRPRYRRRPPHGLHTARGGGPAHSGGAIETRGVAASDDGQNWASAAVALAVRGRTRSKNADALHAGRRGPAAGPGRVVHARADARDHGAVGADGLGRGADRETRKGSSRNTAFRRRRSSEERAWPEEPPLHCSPRPPGRRRRSRLGVQRERLNGRASC